VIEMALPAGLLDAVKVYLGIEGEEQDEEISGIIQDGIDFINGLIGMSLDYMVVGKPQDLLFKYCDISLAGEFEEDKFKTDHVLDLLLIAVRNYLDITWVDSAGDAKLSGIIARGMKYIDSVAGAAMDYTVEDKPRELLFDYCRYARSNALSEFQANYLHELLSLQIAQEVAEYAAENPDV
jgi:hypothetical protein